MKIYTKMKISRWLWAGIGRKETFNGSTLTLTFSKWFCHTLTKAASPPPRWKPQKPDFFFFRFWLVFVIFFQWFQVFCLKSSKPNVFLFFSVLWPWVKMNIFSFTDIVHNFLHVKGSLGQTTSFTFKSHQLIWTVIAINLVSFLSSLIMKPFLLLWFVTI